MVPGRRHADNANLARAADFARQRREQLGMTQAQVASAAGVRDLKTIRNFETGRNWPNDLTRRGIETALQIEIGILDRIGSGVETGEVEQHSSARVGGQNALPTAVELIDLSTAIAKLSTVHEAMLRRGDDRKADVVRGLIDAISGLMTSYGTGLDVRTAGSVHAGEAVGGQ